MHYLIDFVVRFVVFVKKGKGYQQPYKGGKQYDENGNSTGNSNQTRRAAHVTFYTQILQNCL